MVSNEKTAFLSVVVFCLLLWLIDDEARFSRSAMVDHMPTSTAEGPDPRRLVFGQDKYRVAVFGSSNAWGAGADSRFDAYPYALSPTVHNYAAFAAGPNYYSVCTETVLGDHETFDVIIIDYWLRASEGVVELAQRLRERYPHAIIIFVTLWSPRQYRRKETPDSHEDISLAEWKIRQALEEADFDRIKEALERDNGYWWIPVHAYADGVIQHAVDVVNGSHFEFPKLETAKRTIIDYLGYFDKHHHQHVSSIGHRQIALTLKEIVEANVPNHDSTAFLNEDNEEQGSWGKGDYCHLWYTSGNIDIAYDHEHMHMREYDGRLGKFALEVDNEGGYLHVNNPFDEPRTAYLSFLAAKSHVYPNSKAIHSGGTFDLETVTEHDRHDVHIIRTVPIGLVEPGETEVEIKPEETAENRLRLVGLSFTNERAVPHEFGFGPDFN